MFVIRDAQLEALAASRREAFAEALEAELRAELPEPCARVDVRAVIAQAVERCTAYGLATDEAIGRYARLMMVLGRDFDVDPALPWAASILGAPGPVDAAARINELTAAAVEYARRAAGEG